MKMRKPATFYSCIKDIIRHSVVRLIKYSRTM